MAALPTGVQSSGELAEFDQIYLRPLSFIGLTELSTTQTLVGFRDTRFVLLH